MIAHDYDVGIKITFDISALYNGDLNPLGVEAYAEKELSEWVYKTFDIAEGNYKDVPITFTYIGTRVIVSFTIEICDDSMEETEGFADYCILNGAKIPGIHYVNHSRYAEETEEDEY